MPWYEYNFLIGPVFLNLEIYEDKNPMTDVIYPLVLCFWILGLSVMSKKSYINDPTILLFFWSCPLMVCPLWHVYPCWWLISLDRLFPKCVRLSLRDSWQWHSYMHRTLVCVALNLNYFSLLVCFICKVIPHWWNSHSIKFHTLSYQTIRLSYASLMLC